MHNRGSNQSLVEAPPTTFVRSASVWFLLSGEAIALNIPANDGIRPMAIFELLDYIVNEVGNLPDHPPSPPTPPVVLLTNQQVVSPPPPSPAGCRAVVFTFSTSNPRVDLGLCQS